MLSNCILAIFVLLVCATLEHAYNGGYELDGSGNMPKYLSCTEIDNGWTKACTAAGVIGVANYYAPRAGEFGAFILWSAVLATICYIVYSFYKYGNEFREMALSLVALAPMQFTFKATAAAARETALNGAGRFWNTLMSVSTSAIVIAAFAVIIVLFLWRKYLATEKPLYKIAAIVAGVLAAIFLLNTITGANWGSFESSSKKDDDTPTIASTWYKFHHYDLLKDQDLSNDFYFGLSANIDGSVDSARQEHYARLEQDPALGVASLANFDVRLGTDFMEPGYHYDSNQSNGVWTTRINERIQYYMSHKKDYKKAIERWKEFVDKYATVKLTYRKGLKDQMYMISYGSEDEAPQVIVAETDQPDGYLLEYVFLIKGNEFVVPFRTECGLQPTDVAILMDEKPQANPVKKQSTVAKTTTEKVETKSGGGKSAITGGGTNSGGGFTGGGKSISGGGRSSSGGGRGGSGGSGSSGGSTVKDPTKGITGGVANDTSGPGPNTNNGVGAQYSTEEKSTNSAFIKPITGGGESKSAFEVYQEQMSDLGKTNATQKIGGDANTPSYKVGGGSSGSGSGSSGASGGSSSSGSSSSTTTETVTIHSNADTGKGGNGGIDQASSDSGAMHVEVPTSNGGTITKSTSGDSVGTYWGCPTD